MPLNSFFDGHLLLDMEPILKNNLLPQGEYLGGNKLSFASDYQLEINEAIVLKRPAELAPTLLLRQRFLPAGPTMNSCLLLGN